MQSYIELVSSVKMVVKQKSFDPKGHGDDEIVEFGGRFEEMKVKGKIHNSRETKETVHNRMRIIVNVSSDELAILVI